MAGFEHTPAIQNEKTLMFATLDRVMGETNAHVAGLKSLRG